MKIKFKNIKAVFLLITRYWASSFHIWFFALLIPLLVVLVSRFIYRVQEVDVSFVSGLTFSIVFISGVNSLSIAYLEVKDSLILRKINIMPISKIEFIIGIFLSYLLVTFFSSFLFIGVVKFFLWKEFFFNPFSLLFVVIFATFFCCLIGLAVGSICDDLRQISFLNFFILLLAGITGGIYLPLSTKMPLLMQIFQYILPFSYISDLYIWSFGKGSCLFDSSIFLLMDVAIPLLYIIGLVVFLKEKIGKESK